MKLAICLRGHMRTFTSCYSYINTLKQNYDVDVFIHTWEDVGYLKLYNPEFTPDNPGTINLNSGKVDFDLVNRLYEPVKISFDYYEEKKDLFEKMASEFIPWFEEIKNDPTVGNPRMHSFMSQLYKEQEVINMKSQYSKINNKKYDLVLVTRPDVSIDVDFSLFEKLLDNKKDIAVRSISGDINEVYKSIWICNSYFISSDENINKFGTLFSKIDEIRNNLYNLWKETKDVSTYSIMFCIHRLCWYHLKNNNLNPIIGPNATIIR